MKGRIKQILVAIGITVIAWLCLFYIDKVILGEIKASRIVNAYETEHNRYPEEIRMKYDWYSGGGYISANYRYNSEKDIIFDEEYNELWRPYFDIQMEEVQRNLEYNYIMKDYGIAFYFDGTDTITRYDDLFIYGIYNTQPVEEAYRMEKGAEIIMDIISEIGSNYHFCGVHIDYYDLDGVYRFAVPLGKAAVTKEMLMESAIEVSFENNLAIQENWEAFVEQRVTLWTLEVDGYEVSMMGMEDYGNYQLMVKDGEHETVGRIYPNYGEVIEYQYDTFENVLGYSGFYVFDNSVYASYGNFYTIIDGELICVADTWGNTPKECYSVDVDKDGIPELICNVRYGTGEEAAIIYMNNGSQIVEGDCTVFLDAECPDETFYMLDSKYIPNEDVVEITYWTESMEEAISEKYDLDLSKMVFWQIN